MAGPGDSPHAGPGRYHAAMNNSGTSYRGQGSVYCLATAKSTGARCSQLEVEGLEYCLPHMPDEYLEEAEEITGVRRCRTRFGQPDACHNIAVTGTVPPKCKDHGANPGSAWSKQAANRVIEGQAAERCAELLAAHGEALLNAMPVEDPLAELLQLAGEMLAFKDILRARIAMLEPVKWRYTGKTIGEQIRAEVILYERALERLASVLERISRLNIEARLAAIDERVAAVIEQALNIGMEAAGVDIEARAEGQKAMRGYLTSLDSGKEYRTRERADSKKPRSA